MAYAVTRQADGKVVTVGRSEGGFALARYNPDGSPDNSFSDDGKQTTNFGPGLDAAYDMALQPDGKIVVVGDGGGGGDFALARYNPDGSLDTSFSGDGKQTTDFAGDFANGVVLQGDGKIVVVGGGGDGKFALARYNSDGSLDTSFSGDGKQTTDFAGGARANDVALQPDGKIVAVGSGPSQFALARYNPDGSLDTTFSEDGKQTTGFGSDGAANAVALQADGKIVAVGSGTSQFALARYNPDGSLDTTFSDDGKQNTAFEGIFDDANDVSLQPDGKIVAVGGAQGAGFALARYNPNGSLDSSFSEDGKQTTDFASNPFGSFDTAYSVALQPDGKIVAAGDGGADDFGRGRNVSLARYNPDGSLDTSFSQDGKQDTAFPGADSANDVAIQPDGKIITVGRYDSSTNGSDFALVRHNPDGSLDTSFSGDGKQTTDFGSEGDVANAVALQSDGKIVVVGIANGGNFAVTRYNADGSLDTSFSEDGRQTIDFGVLGYAYDVALQPDGKIVVVGEARGFALARFNPDGSLDTSFSSDGKQTTDFGSGGDAANAVALQDDGKIIAVGLSASGSDFASARYNADGSLDPSFSGDGKQTTDFGGLDFANDVGLQPDGKIVVAGDGGSGDDDFALARYNPNGSLDPSFSGDGKQTTDFGGFDSANDVELEPDGKIVAVGSTSVGVDSDFALVRYNRDGSPDSTFAGGGTQTTDFGGFDIANGAALQKDGKIVVVGGGRGSDSPDFVIARYQGDGAPPADTTPPDDTTPPGDTSAPPSGPAPPAPPSPPLTPPAGPVLGPPPFAAKLEIVRARVLRPERRLSVLAPITGRASGDVRAAFRAAGRTERFDAEVDADNRRVRINRRIPEAQARLGTGILTLTYNGDGNTQPQEVRLRAASRRANLDASRPRISNGRLTATGEISRRARGVVRLQLLYEPPGQQTRTLEFTARISDGRYRFNERLPTDVLAGIAARRGVVHSYTLFTGYFENRVRGEMQSFQVLGAR